MAPAPEIVVRNGYLADRDVVVDIAVADGRITAVEGRIDE